MKNNILTFRTLVSFFIRIVRHKKIAVYEGCGRQTIAPVYAGEVNVHDCGAE